ncbi:MAG: DUF4062 domain-containing protein, partial [Planctomycetota bacterium]
MSPSDCAEARDAIREAVGNVNNRVLSGLKSYVEIVGLETHVTPDASAPAQTIINKSIVDSSDFGIAVFWSRVGTPTE